VEIIVQIILEAVLYPLFIVMGYALVGVGYIISKIFTLGKYPKNQELTRQEERLLIFIGLSSVVLFLLRDTLFT